MISAQRTSSLLDAVFIINILWLFCSCGGGGSPSAPAAPPPPPTITSVGVDTSFPYVLAGTSVTFRDTITGTGAFTAGVAWFVNGVPGGDAISGTIDGQGYYTAPAIIPPVSPVTIKATALGDSTKSASTTVSVFTLAFSPTNPVVDYGHPQQFKAIVTGVSNPLVYWVAQYGKFSSDGLYTPPVSIGGPTAQDLITLSINGGNAPIQGIINLKLLPPTLTSITSTGASANQPVIVQGHDLIGIPSLYFAGIRGRRCPPRFRTPPTPKSMRPCRLAPRMVLSMLSSTSTVGSTRPATAFRSPGWQICVFVHRRKTSHRENRCNSRGGCSARIVEPS